MPLLPVAYNLVMLLTCIYVWRDGGRTGRWGVACYLGATALTIVASIISMKFDTVDPLLFVADFSFLCGMIALALLSNRRWPIWASALQLNCVAAHVAAALAPVLVSRVYYAMETASAIPILIAMAGGTALDRRFERRALL